MKLIPYINFNGNCTQAIAFYEKVFGTKSEYCLYEDIVKFDPSQSVPAGKEKWVMHGSLSIGDGVEIQLADCDENGKDIGKNICLQLTYGTAEEVRAIYSALSAGGATPCELQPTFYAPLYAVVIDKFGICWSVMQEHPNA